MSVSGKDWEEVKFNKLINNNIKIDNNLYKLVARQTVSKKI